MREAGHTGRQGSSGERAGARGDQGLEGYCAEVGRTRPELERLQSAAERAQKKHREETKLTNVAVNLLKAEETVAAKGGGVRIDLVEGGREVVGHWDALSLRGRAWVARWNCGTSGVPGSRSRWLRWLQGEFER